RRRQGDELPAHVHGEPVAMRARLLLVPVAVAALALVPAAAASTGVAIDLGRVTVRQSLTPGGSYELPTIGVRNPGTETTTYVLRASPVELEGHAAPPSGWFSFAPARLTLEPGATRAVRVRIALPTGADPGD